MDTVLEQQLLILRSKAILLKGVNSITSFLTSMSERTIEHISRVRMVLVSPKMSSGERMWLCNGLWAISSGDLK